MWSGYGHIYDNAHILYHQVHNNYCYDDIFLFLILAYFLTINIISFVTMRTKSSNVQIKNLFDDISSQIETMSSAQAQIGKSTYYYTKQAAKTITGIEGMYAESQEAIFRNLSSISNAQNFSKKIKIIFHFPLSIFYLYPLKTNVCAY